MCSEITDLFIENGMHDGAWSKCYRQSQGKRLVHTYSIYCSINFHEKNVFLYVFWTKSDVILFSDHDPRPTHN